MSRCLATSLLLVAVASTLFAAGFGLGRYVFPASQPSGSAGRSQNLDVLSEAWSLIERSFYRLEPLDDRTMLYGAIKGMVATLGDRYTAFFTPEQADLFQQDLEGSFAGIGVTVGTTDDGDFRVMRPLAGTPGAEAGLVPGDILVAVDGIPLRGMEFFEAISLMRGQAGTKVRLLVRHANGVENEYSIVRAVIQVPTVDSKVLADGIGYVALSEFNGRATEELRSHLRALLQDGSVALILDLRGNPGGYLHVAVEVASEFIREGVIVIERSSDGKETTRSASGSGLATDVPLMVLVDGSSASAAEIVAGAIQDLGRGIVIGERTLGKGSVQITERLSDRSALQITIERWYTPADRGIHGEGLEPDLPVALSEEDIKNGRDPPLERAMALLMEQRQQ